MYYLLIYDGYVPLNNCSIDIIHLPLGARLECIHASFFFFFFFACKKFTQIIEKISRFLFWHVQQQSRKIANEKPNPCQIKNMSYLHIRFSIDFGLAFKPGLKNNSEEKRFVCTFSSVFIKYLSQNFRFL